MCFLVIHMLFSNSTCEEYVDSVCKGYGIDNEILTWELHDKVHVIEKHRYDLCYLMHPQGHKGIHITEAKAVLTICPGEPCLYAVSHLLA